MDLLVSTRPKLNLAEKIKNADVSKLVIKNPNLGDCPNIYNDWGDSHRGVAQIKNAN